MLWPRDATQLWLPFTSDVQEQDLCARNIRKQPFQVVACDRPITGVKQKSATSVDRLSPLEVDAYDVAGALTFDDVLPDQLNLPNNLTVRDPAFGKHVDLAA